jgi:hypothetical protein
MPWFRTPDRLGERRRVVKISDRLPDAFPLSEVSENSILAGTQ